MAKKPASKPSAPILLTTADLKEDPHNPRTITPEALEGLKHSLASFGDVSGVVFNIRTQQLVTGHQRLTSLRGQHSGELEIVMDTPAMRFTIKVPERVDTVKGKKKTFPAYDFIGRLVDWPIEKQRAANIAANSEFIAGEFTPELQTQLAEIRAGDDALFAALRLESLTFAVPEEEVASEAAASSERQFKIEIDCIDEQEQESIFKRLKKQGLNCRTVSL